MKSFIAILLVAICMSSQAAKDCERRKCEPENILGSNGCRCKVFRDRCELEAYNMVFAPEYHEVDPRECYDCLVDEEWIYNVNDEECPRKPRECKDEIAQCQERVRETCGDLGYAPVPAYSKECGCRIFSSYCHLQLFNCLYYAPEFVVATNTTKCDDCIYGFLYSIKDIAV